MADKILIVDDDIKILRILKLQLEHNGFETLTAKDGNEALKLFIHNKDIALVLLDLMLPEIDGLTLCKKFRAFNPQVKILIVSAKYKSKDVIEGLNSGADDYIRKPFVFDEMLARIKANLRCGGVGGDSGNVLKYADLTVNLSDFSVRRGKQSIELSKTEFDLLEYLLVNNNLVQSRDQILDRVWGYGYFGSGNIVDVYIKYLRDKIDKDFDHKLIRTVRGRGYVLK